MAIQASIGDRGFRHSYEAGAVTVTGDGESARMSLEFAFGAGVQAQTAVGRSGDRWIEYRISLYTAGSLLSLTPGHFGRAVATAGEALGIEQDPPTIARCFSCHAGRTSPDLSHLELGVQCERCHGPGGDHIAAAKAGKEALARKAILNSGRFRADAGVMVCGECHRTPPRQNASPAPELDDPLSIRFQPVGLKASRCFQVSRKLACTTCHDPHDNLRHDPGFYAGRCLSCHDDRESTGCRRSVKADCQPCHMPRSSPAPHLTFTDHRIRLPG